MVKAIRALRHSLEPIETISEILFGLIMVLTVTCSFSVVQAQRKGVRAMLVAALGCNLAWGVIDAVFHLMVRFSEQGHGIVALLALRKPLEVAQAQTILAGFLPPLPDGRGLARCVHRLFARIPFHVSCGNPVPNRE